MQYNGVQQLDQSNISQFAKKGSFCGQGQFGPNLVQKYATLSDDSLSEDLFEILWYDEALDKSNLSHFSKKFPFWGIQAHLAENYTTNYSRNFQKHSSMVWCNSQTLDIFVTFQKKFLSQTSGKNLFRQKWWNLILMIYYVTIFFEMTKHDGIQQLDQSNVGQLLQKIPIWGNNSHPVWAKIRQSSVLLFAF